MSHLSVARYFPFRRAKLLGQEFIGDDGANISVTPNLRFRPICHQCSTPGSYIHSWRARTIRDLNLTDKRIYLSCRYRKVFCPVCHALRVEDLEFFSPYQHVTRRLARYAYELCKMMTVHEVAEHLGLDWKTVKEIDKTFLEKEFGIPKLDGLRILAIDEIAVKKRHTYMTVVLDYETGRVLWMKEGRSYNTLAGFFELMSEEQLKNLEAIALDMWDPYIKAIRKFAPHVKIVFDLYHVVADFGRVIDAVRNLECRKAYKANKEIYKGSRYLLLMNKRRIRKKKARQHLKRLLQLNETLSKLYVLKDRLKLIWRYSYPASAQKALDDWCHLAGTIRYRVVRKFINKLRNHSYGIINHCYYPINSAQLEGANNKIKVIKRKAYGFHDMRYFELKSIQAFST